MGWKGNLVDIPVWAASRFVPSLPAPPRDPTSILVLRNNDIGDLLTTTPLFQALRKLYPHSRITAGVGAWNRDTLKFNPYLSDIVEINAPWTNKYVPDQSTRAVARYLGQSPEVQALAAQKFEIGIDIVGSHVGAALMLRAGIPYRLGVRGYRGGHVACQQYLRYADSDHVSRFALRFAELLGATKLPDPRPQVFLSADEAAAGQARWTGKGRRLLIGPGAGLPEKVWPLENYARLLRGLGETETLDVVIVGGKGDRDAGEFLRRHAPPGARNLAGELSLRETFATVAASDLVVCSASMLMHVAAAFYRPSLVMLGRWFMSLRQQQEQWSYPETRNLGAGGDGPMATPDEAIAAAREALGQ